MQRWYRPLRGEGRFSVCHALQTTSLPTTAQLPRRAPAFIPSSTDWGSPTRLVGCTSVLGAKIMTLRRIRHTESTRNRRSSYTVEQRERLCRVPMLQPQVVCLEAHKARRKSAKGTCAERKAPPAKTLCPALASEMTAESDPTLRAPLGDCELLQHDTLIAHPANRVVRCHVVKAPSLGTILLAQHIQRSTLRLKLQSVLRIGASDPQRRPRRGRNRASRRSAEHVPSRDLRTPERLRRLGSARYRIG